MKQVLKKFLWDFDMFPAPATFRNKEEPEIKTSNIGLLSLLLAIFFTYVFINSLVELFQYKNISYSETINVSNRLNLDQRAR